MINTYDKNINLLLTAIVLPIGTIVTTYTWKINNVNKNSNTSALTINTTDDLIEGKNTISLVVVCEHGTVSNEYVAEVNVGIPPIEIWNDTCVLPLNGLEISNLGNTRPNLKCNPIVPPVINPTLRPTLTSMNPTKAKVGQDVTIAVTGKDFNPTAYLNFYINRKYVDHGTLPIISGTSTQIVSHRLFTQEGIVTVKVNNRNNLLSNTALTFTVLPNDTPIEIWNDTCVLPLNGLEISNLGNTRPNLKCNPLTPTSNPVKIKVDNIITITVTDSVTNLPVQNINIESNGETKVTDSNGKVTFN